MNCLFLARIPSVEKIMMNHLIDSGCFQVEIVGYCSLRSCVILFGGQKHPVTRIRAEALKTQSCGKEVTCIIFGRIL